MALQCVVYYFKNKTLLLGTSLLKPYCSEVHLLNRICVFGWQCGATKRYGRGNIKTTTSQRSWGVLQKTFEEREKSTVRLLGFPGNWPPGFFLLAGKETAKEQGGRDTQQV